MEKETRISKYKELREEMKEEVAIDRRVVVEEDEGDDDFLAFLPRKEEKPHLDDTLMEPLSYETLKQNDEDVKMALKEAKVNVGKEQYNTRLDILSKIKQDDFNYTPRHEGQVKEELVKEEPPKKMTLLEKLAAMSPEEDVEELRKFEEGMTVADLMSQQKKEKQVKKEPVSATIDKKEVIEKREPVVASVIEEDDFEEEEPEKESRLVTVLNYVIVIFIVIFIALACFIVKQLFF